MPCFHNICRVVSFVILTIRVIKDEKWPLTGREPSIESVNIPAHQFTTLFAYWCLISLTRYPFVTLVTEPSGDWNAPDDLSRAIPIERMLHEITKNLFVIIGDKAHFSLAYRT